MCRKLHGLERIDTVADPFLGIGSTAVACAQPGLNFVGVEMDKDYLRAALVRTGAAVKAAPRDSQQIMD